MVIFCKGLVDAMTNTPDFAAGLRPSPRVSVPHSLVTGYRISIVLLAAWLAGCAASTPRPPVTDSSPIVASPVLEQRQPANDVANVPAGGTNATTGIAAGAQPLPVPATQPTGRDSRGSASNQAVQGTLVAPAPIVRTTPISDVREVTDALPISRMIDLTTPPDDLWDRIRNGFAMPNLSTPLVLDRQIWYASRPTYIQRMAERSRLYLYHIVDELEKRGMPTELALLPMVESAFNPMALSSARASGLWQFIPSTGKNYNLKQNWWYDARRDIVASTAAALDYLQFLYDMHGDWHLALASYNWGENAVARAIERNKARGLPTDYASLTMPQETRYYVPKLQALKNILASPDSFRINLDPIPNEPYFVRVPMKDMDIKLAAQLAEMPIGELLALNPAHNRPVIQQGEWLILPADRAELFRTNLENHAKPLVSWQPYTLKKGDRLEKLAADHGIALAKLKQVNSISGKTKVGPGFQLLLPLKGANAEPLPAMFAPPVPTERAVRETKTVTRQVTHAVTRGETLATIADHYKVSIDDLRRWNKVGRLTVGQKLMIEQQVTVSTVRKVSGRKPVQPKQATAKSSKQKSAATRSTGPGKSAPQIAKAPAKP
jgi:membrane-bound lytic murein transglycosylase D